MAIEVRFKCSFDESDYITVSSDLGGVVIKSFYSNELISTCNFDTTTAIKFAKTIRTEINKVKGI